MCLAVPGKVIEIRQSVEGPTGLTGTVDFQGSQMEVGLQMTPEVQVGDWVLVHAGYTLQMLDEVEALEIWGYLREAELVSGLMDSPEGAEPR